MVHIIEHDEYDLERDAPRDRVREAEEESRREEVLRKFSEETQIGDDKAPPGDKAPSASDGFMARADEVRINCFRYRRCESQSPR